MGWLGGRGLVSGVEAGVWAGVLLAEMHRNPVENVAILKKKRFC